MIKAMDGSERGEQFWMDTVRTLPHAFTLAIWCTCPDYLFAAGVHTIATLLQGARVPRRAARAQGLPLHRRRGVPARDVRGGGAPGPRHVPQHVWALHERLRPAP